MTRSDSPTRSGVRVRSTGLPRFARNDAKRQSGAKRRIREAAARRKATQTRTYLGFAPTRASRHCISETSASEAKRLPCFRFASLRGTKQSMSPTPNTLRVIANEMSKTLWASRPRSLRVIARNEANRRFDEVNPDNKLPG